MRALLAFINIHRVPDSLVSYARGQRSVAPESMLHAHAASFALFDDDGDGLLPIMAHTEE